MKIGVSAQETCPDADLQAASQVSHQIIVFSIILFTLYVPEGRATIVHPFPTVSSGPRYFRSPGGTTETLRSSVDINRRYEKAMIWWI